MWLGSSVEKRREETDSKFVGCETFGLDFFFLYRSQTERLCTAILLAHIKSSSAGLPEFEGLHKLGYTS